MFLLHGFIKKSACVLLQRGNAHCVPCQAWGEGGMSLLTFLSADPQGGTPPVASKLIQEAGREPWSDAWLPKPPCTFG